MDAIRTPLVIAAATAVALGSSVYAYASWTMPLTPTNVTMHVVAMPAGNTPSIEQRADKALLRWVPNKIVPGVPAQSYVVTRHGGGAAVEVCKVTTAGCNELRVPSGTWSWTVRPIFATWIGAESAPTREFVYSDPAKPTASAAAAQTLVVDNPAPGTTANKTAVAAPAAAADPPPINAMEPPVPADPVPSSSTPGVIEPSPQESVSSNPTPESRP
jgi:hypothetical protein